MDYNKKKERTKERKINKSRVKLKIVNQKKKTEKNCVHSIS